MTGSENINELFADNAFYLLAHHRRILADSRMSLCSLPSVGGLAYLGSIEGITLGCWLEWWLNCSFSRFYSREEETAPEGAQNVIMDIIYQEEMNIQRQNANNVKKVMMKKAENVVMKVKEKMMNVYHAIMDII